VIRVVFIARGLFSPESFQLNRIHQADLNLSYHCHLWGLKRDKRSKRGINMNDHMFVETLIISSSFFTIAIVLVASVMFLEKRG